MPWGGGGGWGGRARKEEEKDEEEEDGDGDGMEWNGIAVGGGELKVRKGEEGGRVVTEKVTISTPRR